MDKKVTIKDIARLANVSVGTVDRVIHNRGEVAEESRKRVMDILEKTGYKPNLLARTLGINKLFRIAVVLPNPDQDEYWKLSGEGIQLAHEEWAQYGIRIQVHHFDLYDHNAFESLANEVLQSSPDGILTAPIFYQEAVAFLAACRERNIPFVTVNNNIPEAGALSFIGQDLYQSGRLAAELLQIGNAQPGTYAILHIYDDIHNSVHLYEKEKGFKDYFAEQRTTPLLVKSIDLNYTHEPDIEKELKELLSDPQLRGLLVTTSKGASIVSKMLEEHGKNGVRLVAYDLLKQNLHYLAAGIIDFIINQNSKQQAFIGISQLANNLVLRKNCPVSYLFPLEIISRQNLKTYLQLEQHQILR